MPSGKGKKATMPSKEEVERLFGILMEDLAVKPDKKRAMNMLPLENKWLMIEQYKVADKQQTKPADYVAMLKGTVNAKDMEAITVDMLSKPVPWLLEFVNEGGVPPLFLQLSTVLSKPEKVESDVKLLGNFVNCVRGLMNGSEEAIKSVSNAKGATVALIKCLDYIQPKAQRNIWELLTALCYISDESHNQLVDALNKVYKPVDGKKKTSGIKKLKWFLEKGDDGSKGIVMALVNGLVNKCVALEERMTMRENIGIEQTLIEKMETISNDRLAHQLVIFKEELEADIEESQAEGSEEKNVKKIIIQIIESMRGKFAFAAFAKMLSHLELIRQDDRVGIDSFEVLDLFVQSTAHAQHNGDRIAFAKDICDNTLQELGYVKESVGASSSSDRLKELETMVSKLQEQKERDEAAVAELKKKARSDKDEITKLRAEGNDYRIEKSQFQATSAKFEEDLRRLREENDQLRKGAGLPAAAAPKESDNRELLSQIESLKSQLAKAKHDEEASRALSAQIETLKADLSKSHEEVSHSHSEAEILRKENAALRSASSSSDNQELLSLLETLKADLAKSKAEVNTLRKEYDTLKASGVSAPPSSDGPPPPPGDIPPPPPPPGGGPPPPPPPPGGGPPPPPPPPGGGPPPPPPPPGGGPPPPPGGGPPPPPGAPMMAAAPKRPAKAKKDLNVKVKAFNWTKIADAKVDGTIWENEVTDDHVEVDIAQLCDLFSAVKKKEEVPVEGGEGGEGGEGEKKAAKKKEATVLDFQRSNNINILVKRFKKTPQEMKKAILDCDAEVMVADNIRALLKTIPTPEELEMIKEYPNFDELGGAEKFLLALGEIPRLEARLKALLIKDGFEKRAATVEEQMKVLEKGIEEVESSKNFKEFLKYVLKVGNLLNGAGARGGAYGFKLEDLVKLGDTKSYDNKTSLLAFLQLEFEKKHPHLLALDKDFPTLTDASRESFVEVSKDVSQLEGDRNFAKNQLVEGERDKFQKTIAAFLEDAESLLSALLVLRTSIEQKFNKLKKLYGEQPTTDTNQFFENLVKFMSLYTQTWEGILRQRKANEDRAKAEKKRLEMQAKGKAGAKEEGAPAEGEGGEDLGAVDRILQQAQQGARVQRNPRPGPKPGVPGMGPPGMGGFDPAMLRAGLKKRPENANVN